MKRIKHFLENFIEDIFIISGMAVGVFTTFRLNTTAGLYCMSAVMLILGVYFAMNPLGRRNNK